MGAQLGGESLDPLFSLIGPFFGLFDSVFGLLGSVFGLLGSLSAGQKELSCGVHPAQPRFFPIFVGAAPQFQAQAGDRKWVESALEIEAGGVTLKSVQHTRPQMVARIEDYVTGHTERGVAIHFLAGFRHLLYWTRLR